MQYEKETELNKKQGRGHFVFYGLTRSIKYQMHNKGNNKPCNVILKGYNVRFPMPKIVTHCNRF